jgi:hypothetical protein
MPSATSKKTTRPLSPSISRTEQAKGRPKTVTIRPLERGDLTAEEFDRVAREHGARPLTGAEKRSLARIAETQER